LLLCFFKNLQAQIYTLQVEPSTINEMIGNMATSDIPAIFVAPPSEQTIVQLKAEDLLRESQGKTPRLAIPISANINSSTSGTWSKYKHPKSPYSDLWIMSIQANGAGGLAPIFSQLDLSQGEMWLYTNDKKQLMGPINAKTIPQKVDNAITDYLYGESFTIAYFSNSRTPIQLTGLEYIYDQGNNNLVHNPNDMSKRLGYGASLPCEIDASTSPLSDCFRFERNAVAVLLKSNSDEDNFCTSTIVNNTLNDFRPLVLTASHCFAQNFDKPVPSEIRIRFKWWEDLHSFEWHFDNTWFATQTVSNGYLTFCGADPIAINPANADFALIKMQNSIMPEHEITFLGWAAYSWPENSTFLHHPLGDVLKITHDDNRAEITDVRSAFIEDRGWLATFKDDANDFGILEKGSSGSALLNQRHLICGQHSSVTANADINCDPTKPLPTNNGRFSSSWLGNGNSSTYNRLIDHLAPRGSRGELEATFQIYGTDFISCARVEHIFKAPRITTSDGTLYEYRWRVSTNLSIVRQEGELLTVVADNPQDEGVEEFVEAEIFNTSKSCTGMRVGASKKVFNWSLNVKVFHNNSNRVAPQTTFVARGTSNTFTPLLEGANATTRYTWQVNSTSGNPYYSAPNAPTFDIYFPNTGSAYITLTATTMLSTGETCVKQRGFVVVAGGYGLVGDDETLSFIAYPNPNSGTILSLQILNDLQPSAEKEVTISDIQGQVVFRTIMQGNNFSINTENYTNGIYLLTVQSEKGRSLQKLIIQR
jgi:hypothetical protein